MASLPNGPGPSGTHVQTPPPTPPRLPRRQRSCSGSGASAHPAQGSLPPFPPQYLDDCGVDAPSLSAMAVSRRKRTISAHSDGTNGEAGLLEELSVAEAVAAEERRGSRASSPLPPPPPFPPQYLDDTGSGRGGGATSLSAVMSMPPRRIRSISAHSDGRNGEAGLLEELAVAEAVAAEERRGPRAPSPLSNGGAPPQFPPQYLDDAGYDSSGVPPPRRERSVSAHSDGRGGETGLLEELSHAKAIAAEERASNIMFNGLSPPPPPPFPPQYLDGPDDAGGIGTPGRRMGLGNGAGGMATTSSAASEAATAPTAPRSDVDGENAPTLPPPPPPPPKTERERLVERERQSRIETERARLRRQMALTREREEAEALSIGGGGRSGTGDDEDDDLGAFSTQSRRGDPDEEDSDADGMADEVVPASGSVAGTLGDGSSVGRNASAVAMMSPVTSAADDVAGGAREDAQEALPYTMERFLSDKDHPLTPPAAEPLDDMRRNSTDGVEPPSSVVLETGNVIAASIPSRSDESPRRDAVDLELGEDQSSGGAPCSSSALLLLSSSTAGATDTVEVSSSSPSPSALVPGSSSDIYSPRSHQSSEDRQPRLVRLTEAEIVNMAEIDYASVGNAPPHSVRDERLASFSESSVTGGGYGFSFGGRSGNLADHAFSEATRTTVQESMSVTSAGGRSSTLDHPSQEEHDGGNDDDREGNMAAAGVASTAQLDSLCDTSSVSVEVMPGEDVGMKTTGLSPRTDEDDLQWSANGKDDSHLMEHNSAGGSVGRIANDYVSPPLSRRESMRSSSTTDSKKLVNRVLRPGFPGRAGRDGRPRGHNHHQRAQTTPAIPLVVDDFDYDKYDQDDVGLAQDSFGMSSSSDLHCHTLPPVGGTALSSSGHSDRRHSNDPNEPVRRGSDGLVGSSSQFRPVQGVQANGDHAYFPERGMGEAALHLGGNRNLNYGTLSNGEEHFARNLTSRESGGVELSPLLTVPREVTMSDRAQSVGAVGSVVDKAFSTVRSVSTETLEADMNDSDKYLLSGMLARAFPDRCFALLVTLIIEIPVLLIISGGSDQLCSLVGKKRYQLMMGFLPLSSAISGNCGLQGSTLTTRAVSHLHVTKDSYGEWLKMEVGASCFLGLAMGSVLGTVAYHASGQDFAFGVTICFAQFISIVTAGFTGTLAPLIFTFIFHRDAGKWGGPLETAIQDIVGSFAMVVLSYRLLVLFGPSSIDPSDTCG